MLFLFSGPPQIRPDRLVFYYFIERIEFPTKQLLRELSMDKGMASSADIDAPLLHVRSIKILSEPLVTMATPGNKMMEGNGPFATTKRTFFTHMYSDDGFLFFSSLLG